MFAGTRRSRSSSTLLTKQDQNAGNSRVARRTHAACRNPPPQQVCVQLPTSAVNVALPAFAAVPVYYTERPPFSKQAWQHVVTIDLHSVAKCSKTGVWDEVPEKCRPPPAEFIGQRKLSHQNQLDRSIAVSADLWLVEDGHTASVASRGSKLTIIRPHRIHRVKRPVATAAARSVCLCLLATTVWWTCRISVCKGSSPIAVGN